jgi:hypothetical protein
MIALLLATLVARADDVRVVVHLADPAGRPIDGTRTVGVELVAAGVVVHDRPAAPEVLNAGALTLDLSPPGDAWFRADTLRLTVGGQVHALPILEVPVVAVADRVESVRSEPASSACGAVGAIRWDPVEQALVVCDGADWVIAGRP